MSKLKVGIVGSRRRCSLRDRSYVYGLIDRLIKQLGKDNFKIVSGACRLGADNFAASGARLFEIELDEYPVVGAENRWDFAKKAFARNRVIADQSDVLFCLVHSDRTGGTENTIKHANEFGKRVFLVDDEGDIYLSSGEEMILCPGNQPLPLRSKSTG